MRHRHPGILCAAALACACGSADKPAPESVPPAVHDVAPTPPVDPPGERAREAPLALPAQAKAPSRSLGSPTNGSLRDGAPLAMTGEGFHFNDRRSSDARYGTDEVVAAIARAAAVVRAEQPGSELTVNDLSLPSGGPIPHHGSHRAGRDADILFYLLDDRAQPTPSVGAPLDPEGVGFDYKDLASPDDDLRVHFDAPRTWRFVAALLADKHAVVQRIFVVEHLRTLLLAEARRSRAPAPLRARFEDVSCQPSYPHDDHLHVRWFCSVEDIAEGCQESAPIYPWHADALAALGTAPVLAKLQHAAEPPEVVTQAQADKAVKATSPHADVLAFLKRRKAWEKQPHPGRPFCR